MASNNSDENKSWARKAFEAVEQAAAKKEREIPESIKVPGLPVAVQPSEYEAPSGGGVWGDVAKGLYDTAMSDYNRLKTMYTDQTEEAKKIRSTWETAPTVSVKNGRLKLSGSKDFLASSEAKQLRETMKEMKGSTYNTEDLNKQIESWNAVLAKMSEQYINALDTLNPMNAAIAQSVEGTTREDFQRYFTLNDLQKIGNSASIGKQQDARTTKNKIFVGFEWDDDGNMVEKWVNAADFFKEFNDQSDDEKRSAYHSLITQANLGDVGAYSKLMYLQGGSKGGPANVDIDGTGTFFENILQGAEAGAAGVLQDIFDYAPILNLGTISGNISDAAENADQRNFWDWAAAIMAPGLYADKYDSKTGLLKVYNDAVTDFNNLRDWSNTYTAELNPASTEIGRTVGDFAGGALRIAGDIYAFGKLGQLEADTKFAAMQIANQKFAGSSAFTPMGQIYIKKYGVQVADQVTPLADNGGVATMGRTLRDTTTITPFGGIYVPTVLTKISPKFTQFLEEAALAFTEVQFARNASQFISKDGATVLQFGAAKPTGTKIAWSDNGIGAVVEPMTQAQWSVKWGPVQRFTYGSNIRSAWDTFSRSAGGVVSDSTALSNTVNFSSAYEFLKSLRNKDTILGISKGLQTAQALSNLVGFAAMRNVDDYFQRVEAGEDVGDMADYIITHTAEDAVWGGLIMKAGGMMKFFKRGADASAKPTVEYVQEVYDGMANSQSGWYMPGTYASSRFLLGPGALSESEVSDINSTLSTIMTTNGEAIVGFSGELGGVSAVPGTNIKEAGKALGVYSPSKITRLSVQPAVDGAYLVREETNLDTNTKVETRKFYTDIEEATKAAASEAVPKTSPKTLENSDQVNNAKVAPLAIDGKTPNVMPDGVSQVRVQPGIVYRTPDNVVESLINIAAQEGWHETNQDRLYREYEQYQREVEAQQNAMEILSGEAPALPREMYGTDIESILRIAAAAKVAGYNYIPFKEDRTVETPNNFVVSAYGVPFEYFPTAEEALDFASQNNVFEVHELSDEPMTLDRPPVTTENISEPLLLESGASAENYLERLTGLLQSMQEMEDSDINYSYGIIDALKQVRGIYSQVSANVNLTDIYARYAQSIYEGKEIRLTPDERKALKPLTDALDALGHYFDPSGKSLTKEFYLPTGAATRDKVSIEKALLGEDEIVDAAMPLDGGLEEILIDADRIGDSGFWQKRTGELFMDSEGNFTMSKAAPLEDNLIAYTVSALTRGPHKLTLAVNNEVARSKANPNRTQITAKQARAMLQEADTLRTKTRSYQLGTHKDAEKIAKLKMDYTGDESTVDQALKEKKYAKKLNYTRALNTLSQKGGFNQFLDIHPIKGSVTRFGAGPYKGTANIKRKMSEINITGTMYKYDNGHWENYGFGIEPSQANIKKYGVFKDGGGAVNLGEILKFNFESEQRALDFYGKIKEDLKNYAGGDGRALQEQLDTFARDSFPLHTNIDKFSAKLMNEFGKNLYAYNNDVIAAEAANLDSMKKWLRTGALICFNNAIQMGDIQNLDKRTIEALDDAAAELLVGSPVKRSAAINFIQRWSVDSALGLNANLVIGNVGSEIFTRLPGYVGTPATIAAFVKALNPAEFRRVRNILKDLPLHFDDSNSALARRVYNRVSDAVSKAEDVALTPLTWSELFKNVVYYLAGERNAIKSGITDPVEIGQSALNFVGEHAIAGGRGTTPGVAESSLGRVLFIFKTFTVRNFDDFLDFVKKASHGRSGDNYWDKKYEKRHKGDDKDTIDLKIAARVIGGRAFRSYIFWLFVGSYFGKTFLDALGGDPTGILEGGYDRGLYDDPDTEEYEGMTDFDNFINNIPAGFILGAFQDLYFAARRRGIEAKQFFGIDIFNDPRLQKDLSRKLPLGMAKNRLGDMLSLLDRGYSFSSTGKKTYAAPDTVWDLTKGFLFGKSTTANSLAYGKYRYGNVNIWGDISSGDWMDFAINANPLTDIFGGSAKFDTTRKDYTGVFDGSWNDIATMQLIIQQFRERNKQIIADFQENKYRYRGDYENLTDEEKLAKAKEQREKDIDKFTDDVQRAVDAFTKAGNTLSDSQITTMMYLFDFHEGEEDEEWNSSYARERYVEAGLPDYSALGVKRVEKEVDGEKTEETQNILDRSLILKNAQQGFYGSSKEAANAIKEALKDFGSTYKAYNTRVKALNSKYFEARNKNKKSAETKRLSQDLEKLQNEYLDKLFDKIAPVIDQYGTALVGTYDGADVLSEYMGNMIPYSSIRKYGQTYSSGNDVVYGQLTEWLQKRLGRNAPTAPSDKEVTSGISDIKKLIDQGKAAAAKSKARAILEKIGRGSLGARRDDVETLRSYAYD